MSGTPAYGWMGPDEYATEHNTLMFIITQTLARFRTIGLVQVKTCSNNGGLAPWGTVVATPMINMIDGIGQPQKHSAIYNMPYIRLQGGNNAFICDPAPGDIGLALICDRDISNPKSQLLPTGQYNPATARVADMADGIYLGGCLNGVPKQYIQFDALGNINAVAKLAFNITAPGGLTVNGVPVTVP